MTVLWAKKDTREEIRAWEIFCSDLLSGMSMVSRCMPVTESMRRPMQGALWVWPSQCGGTIRAWWVGGRVWADPPTLPSWAYSIHRIAFQLDLYWLIQKGWCQRRLYWPFICTIMNILKSTFSPIARWAQIKLSSLHSLLWQKKVVRTILTLYGHRILNGVLDWDNCFHFCDWSPVDLHN